MNALTLELAQAAARLVVEEGLEYAAAKRKAVRALGAAARRPELPSNEAVEDAVREELALFHAEEQPAELRALRALALRWMDRLEAFRPHLSGAVWRGTATRLSAIHIDLYADDAKSPEIALLNLRIAYEALGAGQGGPGEPQVTLALADRHPGGGPPVTLFLAVHDHDDLRGALKPDSRGRSWRGDARALRRLLDGATP